MCMFCRSLFVLLSFFFWLFFDLRILITPLVSSRLFLYVRMVRRFSNQRRKGIIQFAALILVIELVYFGFVFCQQVVRVLVSGYNTDHSIYFNTNYSYKD